MTRSPSLAPRPRAIALTRLAVLIGLVAATRTAAAQGAPNREAAIEVRKQYLADLDDVGIEVDRPVGADRRQARSEAAESQSAIARIAASITITGTRAATP